MSDFERGSVCILARCYLVRTGLELIVSELELRFVSADEAVDVPDGTKVVLFSFTSVEGLLSDIETILDRPDPPRLVLFPQDPELLKSLPNLPADVAAIVSPRKSSSEIKSVISLVADGHRILPFAANVNYFGAKNRASRPFQLDVLTDRQLEILREVAKGQSNKAIARALSISINTVEAHVSKIIRKLNVDNRTQAALALQKEPEAHNYTPQEACVG